MTDEPPTSTDEDPEATDRAPTPTRRPARRRTVPAAPEQLQPEVVGVRHGMFGVKGSGDTSGYGGLVRPSRCPAAPAPVRGLVRRGRGRPGRGARAAGV